MADVDTLHAERALTVDRPATYRIQVVGYLDQNWSTRLGGMKIDPSKPDEKNVVTTLSGLLSDQAALVGVIKALYDMRLPLLSVVCLEVKQNNRL